MSEGGDDDDSKTESPTQRRLDEARKRGQVVYSREVANWVMLFTATLLISMAAPGIMSDLKDVLSTFIAAPHTIPTDPNGLREMAKSLFGRVAGDLAFPLLSLMAVGILSGLAQTGPLLTTEPLTPDLSKLSIFKGFGRLFSMRSIAEFVKGLLKLLVVSVAIYMSLRPYFDGVEHFIDSDISQVLFDLRSLFTKMMVSALIVTFVIALADYAYQRYDFMQKMMMSKQEMKEEFRQTEGDPHVKARLRQLREQKARQRMMQAVPEADVVITNPTHYAVALKYDTAKMDAPQMVAKGIDAVAQRIRDVAKEHEIPVVENPTLARALYDSMEIEQTIPHEQYKAVAEVISYVFKLRGRR